MKVAIVDEAGDVGRSSLASRYLIMAAIAADNIETIRRVVTRTRKRLDKRRRDIPEFKAFKTDPRVIRKLLAHLAETNCEILIAVAYKPDLLPRAEAEDVYRDLCALLARRCVDRYNQVTLILDRRYTDPDLTNRLAQAISAALADSAGMLVIEPPRESLRERSLQAADAVAWSAFQRWEHDDASFYELFSGKIVWEGQLPK